MNWYHFADNEELTGATCLLNLDSLCQMRPLEIVQNPSNQTKTTNDTRVAPKKHHEDSNWMRYCTKSRKYDEIKSQKTRNKNLNYN